MVPFDYITLGDGDFTYSLDLCRFLRVEASFSDTRLQNDKILSTANTKTNFRDGKEQVSVLCSGIDSKEELESKYTDIDHTLQKLLSLNGKVPTSQCTNNNTKNENGKDSLNSTSIDIHIHHCVNAIYSNNPTHLKPMPAIQEGTKFKQVIFNHPHLGEEDAVKHSRFLAHFFHSVSSHWLADKPNAGVLHLTLVKGQYERWKCEDAARKHGFVVLNRGPFKPPPPPGYNVDKMIHVLDKRNDHEERSKKKLKTASLFPDTKLNQGKDAYKSHFQHRRHQSGKSFASRAEGGSETITFGRKEDKGFYVTTCLPWQNFEYDVNPQQNKDHQCPHCEKCFGDKRALKNHIKCVHDGSRKEISYTCELCKNVERIFTSKEALDAHKKAKHGKYMDVKPDWAKDECKKCNDIEKDSKYNSTKSTPIGHCMICDLNFFNDFDKLKHLEEFIPITASKVNGKLFQCSKCNKEFHDRRAQQQHENFCESAVK